MSDYIFPESPKGKASDYYERLCKGWGGYIELINDCPQLGKGVSSCDKYALSPIIMSVLSHVSLMKNGTVQWKEKAYEDFPESIIQIVIADGKIHYDNNIWEKSDLIQYVHDRMPYMCDITVADERYRLQVTTLSM